MTVHIPAKFRENTAMRFQVTVQKLNLTDRQTDRVSISPIPGLRRGGRYKYGVLIWSLIYAPGPMFCNVYHVYITTYACV